MFGGMIMFLKYLNILEGRIKNIYQWHDMMPGILLRRIQGGFGGDGGRSQVSPELIIGSAGFGSLGPSVLLCLHFYTFEILHNRSLKREDKKFWKYKNKS